MTSKGQAMMQDVYHILHKAPTVTLRGMRDEAMTQAPEWRDVGKRTDRIIQQREAGRDGAL